MHLPGDRILRTGRDASGRPRQSHRAARPGVEGLEGRQLMAADPVGGPAVAAATLTAQLNPSEVQQLLQRASAATASTDAIIAITDRGGRVLGVRVENGVSPEITGNAQKLVFAVDGALAKARTGALFGNNQAPLTSRTIQDISQSTITQREIEANPSIQDVNSNLRGPGFVAPLGIKAHFPAGVPFTPQVDLFEIEHTNRDSIRHPGPDRVKGTADDVTLPNRFNVAQEFIPETIAFDGTELTAPESYGFVSGLEPDAQARGIATLPGGIPIIRRVMVDGKMTSIVIGGIGVFFPGTTGYATEENSRLNDSFYNPRKRDRSAEAEFISLAALGGSSAKNPITGASLKIGALGNVKPVPGLDLKPFGRIDLVGITLDVIGPHGNQGPSLLLKEAKKFGIGKGDPNGGTDLPVSNDVSNQIFSFTTAPQDTAVYPGYETTFVVPGTGQVDVNQSVDPATNTRGGRIVPDGWLVTPHGGDGLTAEDVVQIVNQGIARANTTRAAIRLPINRHARMVFTVTDREGNILGQYRMPDATIFSIDVATAKARNVAYYADPAQLQPADQLPTVPVGTAITNRTVRYLAEPRFPEGIDGFPPGPWSILNDGGSDRFTGLNTGPALPASAFQSVQGYDAFNPGTNFKDQTDVLNQNGIVFFPGSSALYKDVDGSGRKVLVGGLGVSGDGVDQDDVVTFTASLGFRPEAPTPRADQVFVRGIRLPYQKFNRQPNV
ncbi:heme-binding protein [Tundrisphaera sp. TA3]|uniref:heme-binding protein n=1 Tax=Tundrisphaera sp. TA3 TaxID=3435775 RepID=UPI003EB7A781